MLIAFLSTFAVSSRQKVDISLGWRHHLGNVEAACPNPAAAFPTNFSGVECVGLQQYESGNPSPTLCAAACCGDPTCSLWQYDSTDAQGKCWAGNVNITGKGVCFKSTAWQGARRDIPTPPSVPWPATIKYDDNSWNKVDTPHDFLIDGRYASDLGQGQAFLPKNVSWYRKHMSLPSDWEGNHIDLYVEGAYSVATYYLNGHLLGTHATGYTSAIFRLDNATGLQFGAGSENILAIYIDATAKACTGWWYEGGGLFRNTYLISTSQLHAVPHGVFAPAYFYNGFKTRSTPAMGMTANNAFLRPEATIVGSSASSSVSVVFQLYARGGSVALATAKVSSVTIVPGIATLVTGSEMSCNNTELWTVARPFLHTIVATISDGATVADVVNVTVGLRQQHWDPAEGFVLNEQNVKMRGFCNHESFAGVGMAVSDRINLFRLQSMRGLGGNAVRASHNPPNPAMLSLADRLGVMFLDENRVFAVGDQYTQNMKDLVSRDRNHPSVMFYSFCNEPGCNNADKSAPTQPSYDFKDVTYEIDGTRPVTGNMCVGWGPCPAKEQYLTGLNNNMSQILDIQGFSHVSTDMFQDYHAVWPNKPLVASECCSCETQRGEDDDMTPAVHQRGKDGNTVFYSNFNIDCVKEQTQTSNALAYVAGTFVWTLHDYFGEPDAWPHISSSFGSYDLAGFPKAAVWWYRSWWLANIPMMSPDRPPIENTSSFVHIAESWQPHPNKSISKRVIHVYSNEPSVTVAVNGGTEQNAAMDDHGYATFDVEYASGTITASAVSASGVAVAKETKSSFGAAATLVLSLDAPSVATGTGSAVYLDGKDVALVRCTVVDGEGNAVHTASHNVTFAVASGPGLVWGTGSGNPSDHNHNHNPTRAAYHGLSRAIIRTTIDAAGNSEARALRKLINTDAGASVGMASIMLEANGGGDSAGQRLHLDQRGSTGIVVTASSPGLGSVTLTIPTSTDPADAPMAVAERSIASGYTGY